MDLEGKDKAFTKFGLEEALHRDAPSTTAAWVTRVLYNNKVNITKTSVDHCWSGLSCQSAFTEKEWGIDEIHN